MACHAKTSSIISFDGIVASVVHGLKRFYLYLYNYKFIKISNKNTQIFINILDRNHYNFGDQKRNLARLQ